MEKTLMQARADHFMTSGSIGPETDVTATPAEPTHYRRVTLNLPVELLDQLRNTVYWTPGVTLTGLIKSALCESAYDAIAGRGSLMVGRICDSTRSPACRSCWAVESK